MNYVVYFYGSDIDSYVLECASECNQIITGIFTSNDDTIGIEFRSNRRFERDMFLAQMNAKKSQVFFDRYEVIS